MFVYRWPLVLSMKSSRCILGRLRLATQHSPLQASSLCHRHRSCSVTSAQCQPALCRSRSADRVPAARGVFAVEAPSLPMSGRTKGSCRSLRARKVKLVTAAGLSCLQINLKLPGWKMVSVPSCRGAHLCCLCRCPGASCILGGDRVVTWGGERRGQFLPSKASFEVSGRSRHTGAFVFSCWKMEIC